MNNVFGFAPKWKHAALRGPVAIHPFENDLVVVGLFAFYGRGLVTHKENELVEVIGSVAALGVGAYAGFYADDAVFGEKGVSCCLLVAGAQCDRCKERKYYVAVFHCPKLFCDDTRIVLTGNRSFHHRDIAGLAGVVAAVDEDAAALVVFSDSGAKSQTT